MMTNKEILRTAMEQSAVDANCQPEDFMKTEPVIVTSRKNPTARRYLKLPLACNLISYGNNIVASIDRTYEDIVWNYIQKYPVEHCFETPNLHVLNEAFAEHGLMVCFMAEYFLPDVNALAACSADCDSMWQIGIDVLPQYRRQGIASALTGTLALEILERGKVPFYCCAWSNIRSARNAIRSGFRPAWVEVTVKPKEFVERMNR